VPPVPVVRAPSTPGGAGATIDAVTGTTRMSDGSTTATGMAAVGAFLVMLVGAVNMLDGIVAVVNADYFRHDIIFTNVEAWGWLFIAFGLAQFAAGGGAWAGFRGAQWAAVVFAGLNAVVQLAHLEHYPAWSVTAIVLDIAVIYFLVVHGSAMERDWAAEERRERAATADFQPGPGIT
jgi:hypothetical protein